MKLSEIFTQLSHGELSQMHLGGSGTGIIEDAAYDRLVSCINLGLAALHTRFPIRHGQLTLEFITTGVAVHYRASHPYLPAGVGMYRANMVDIDLPYQYLEALCYFIASRINNPMGMTNEFHAGNSYAAKYEMACLALERDNIRVDQVSQPDRIGRNGWV